MALPSFLKRKDPPAAQPKPTAEGADVLQARVRARRRLIGAAVLLVVGVVTFPLLFETQPRPIPVDIPIETTRKDAAAPLPASSRPARPLLPAVVDPNANVTAEAPVQPASAPAAPPPAASARVEAPRPASAPPAVAAAPAKETLSPPAVAAAPAKETQKDLPKEAPAAKPAASAAAADAKSGRFVVQVGAFADAGAARDVRVKVERLGLKTYTQVVDTDGGKRTRVRIGPFESRDDAGKVLAKLKSANLPGAVLTL